MRKIIKRQKTPMSRCLCAFFVFCLSASFAAAETLPWPTGLTGFLVCNFIETSQSNSAQNVPMKVARLSSSRQEQLQNNYITTIRTDQEFPQEGPPAEDTIGNLKRKVWRAGVSMPESRDGGGIKSELQKIIKRIRSVEVKPQDKVYKPVIVVEPVPSDEPNEILPNMEALKMPGQKEVELGQTYGALTEQTLQILRNSLLHPEKIDKPFELGEVLFCSGYLEEAVKFYQEALKRDGSDEEGTSQDRAWILFQIGNCLHDDDPEAAMKMYRRLITEYPDSPWTSLAKAWYKLLDWYQKDKPLKLIAENQS
jgi:tetratricopeptide (TPR) repeat protein